MCVLIGATWSLTPRVHAQVVQPWERLGAGLERIYGWPNILLHVSAAAVTPPLALWVDEPVQREFQQHDPFSDTFGEATIIVGGITPAAIPMGIYLSGLAAEHDELATAGAAAIQAAVVQAVVVGTLKWLTDRAGPFPNGDPTRERWNSSVFTDSNSARDFNFNPFDLRWGARWPSGHTSSNVAIVSALYAFYPNEPWIALLGYPAALAIGVGTIEGDYHWLSDVIAGALIGHVIGYCIGLEFRDTYEARRRDEADDAIPSDGLTAANLGLSTQPLGLQISGKF